MSRTHRNPLNLQKLSGQLLFLPRAADGTYGVAWQDLGNITMHKRSVSAETVKGKFHPPTAVAVTVREDVKSLDTKWEITANETFRETLALQLFGADNGANNQASAASATANLADVVLRRIYKVGKVNVSITGITKAGDALIVGTRDQEGTITPANADVVKNDALGTVEILDSGTVVELDDLVVTFTTAAVNKRSFKAGTKPNFEGRFELYEYDGQTLPFRRVNFFDGDLRISNPPEQNPEGEFGTFSIEITVNGDWTCEEVE